MLQYEYESVYFVCRKPVTNNNGILSEDDFPWKLRLPYKGEKSTILSLKVHRCYHV